MTFRNVIATLSAVVMFAACGAHPTQAHPAQARPLNPDADFLIAAHQGNLAQITVGRLAKRKGTTEPVRAFGREFAVYHRRLDTAVREAAARLQVELPAEPNSEQRTLVEQYRAADGADFDTLFLGSQLIAHERAITLTRIVLDTGSEPSVENLATAALPVLQHHHQALTDAQRKLPPR
ncbi:DUF4142 domain-containing protein [Actinoplanes sp. DH11]|uniref:DUF4142 domain-containing protein n=1 Tax=Actinoplanes sp. DH11 TaxID=2857011 RepID=UPI001E2FE501|nr:DUF4142 domain-containing protein [Actinoplanes sp. DH11]